MAKRVAPGRVEGRGRILGLAAFEKISAVESLTLTAAMKRDLRAFEKNKTAPEERTRILLEKYGRASL
ncbi:hypothetical protein [Methylobacterium organophilum]|uniref:Uncharacterized protein n=1 Tax=Methylobacterium organophilum TaxID=410 RepID=A0ABQ4TFP0_METOR|nr:hypothetical protein [Methylobacterium organophilum]GJE28945.1 hypothetical protein LKMONMHP_3820 [Methylobacterium organophilum]